VRRFAEIVGVSNLYPERVRTAGANGRREQNRGSGGIAEKPGHDEREDESLKRKFGLLQTAFILVEVNLTSTTGPDKLS
jgi:hypothetical protein